MTVAAAHEICDRIESALQDKIDDARVAIHIEPESKAKHAGILVRPDGGAQLPLRDEAQS